MQLSKLEDSAYEKLKENGISLFKTKDLCLLLGIKKVKAYNLIKAMKKKDIIKKLGNGFFVLKGANEFAMGAALSYPSYVSFWSAMNYYGFSDQMPKRIFLAARKYTKDINNFKYITLSKKRFFGYTKIGEMTVAEKEKAIIDSILFPKYSGGINEIIKSIHAALNDISIKKLLSYALKVESKAVLRRLGFILENESYAKKSLEKIRKNIGNGYELLDPSLKRKNNLNKRWLLDINC